MIHYMKYLYVMYFKFKHLNYFSKGCLMGSITETNQKECELTSENGHQFIPETKHTCSTWGLGGCSLEDSNIFSGDFSFWND